MFTSIAQRPSVRRFGLNLLVHGTVLLLVAGAFIFLAGIGGGALGIVVGISLFGGGTAMSIPGLILASLLLSSASGRRLGRWTAALAVALISGASMAVIAAQVTARANHGPDAIDARPIFAALVVFAAVAGFLAGRISVALHEALAKGR